MTALLLLMLILLGCGYDVEVEVIMDDPNQASTTWLVTETEVTEPTVPTIPLTSLIDVGGVCRIDPDWIMHRAESHVDKNCAEYAKVLTDAGMQHAGFTADYFPYLALCWLMDECSK